MPSLKMFDYCDNAYSKNSLICYVGERIYCPCYRRTMNSTQLSLKIQHQRNAHGMVDVYDGFGHVALNSLPNGVYVLQVQAHDVLHQTKLVVVKP